MTFLVGIWKFVIGGGWKQLLIGGLVAAALWFAWDFYTDYQDMVAQQVQDAKTITALESAASVNSATIAEMERQARENAINRQILEESKRESERRVSELESLLSRHDLEFLAISKPGLIERRINDATDEAFDRLSCITDPTCVSAQ